MTALALARSWRPKTFTQLVGQDHVVKALTHALDQGRLHHAWLFTGTPVSYTHLTLPTT